MCEQKGGCIIKFRNLKLFYSFDLPWVEVMQHLTELFLEPLSPMLTYTHESHTIGSHWAYIHLNEFFGQASIHGATQGPRRISMRFWTCLHINIRYSATRLWPRSDIYYSLPPSPTSTHFLSTTCQWHVSQTIGTSFWNSTSFSSLSNYIYQPLLPAYWRWAFHMVGPSALVYIVKV